MSRDTQQRSLFDDDSAVSSSPATCFGPIARHDDAANAVLAAQRIEPKLGTRRSKVLAALRRRIDEWVDGTYLETPEVGGSQGTRRARELRSAGFPIELRPHPYSATAWQYRLRSDLP